MILRPHYRLACLSNTNALDVKRFRDELLLHERFDHCFFSNEIALRKPDPACYHHVVEHLGVLPGEIVFFDDSLECVSGARDVGIRAYQCDGIQPLRATLRELDILPRE